ncbi:MAG: thioredoxin-dependent thiol peroxidase [Rubricoccaceae bacterium]
MADMPGPGQPAPPFEGTTQSGDTIRLADYAGQPVALYFYPKDDTPGCTTQACNLRDHHHALLEAGVAVIGVSPDDAASHARFADKHALPFPLLADTDHRIATTYGAWGEKNFYGKKIVGIRRTTFLIGPDGTILHVFRRPRTDRHAEEILERLRETA